MEITSADGTRLVVRKSGQGPPVVLVHGSNGGLDSWDPIRPLLEDDFELWVYARRGYLPSGMGTGPTTYAQEVDDAAAVIAAAGGRAHLVGGSLGATIALHTAVTTGGVLSLAIFEPALYAAGEAVAGLLGPFRELLAAGDVRAANRLFSEHAARIPTWVLDMFAPGPDPSPQAMAEAVGCRHDLEAMAADSLDVDRWARIEVPVLLMQGADTWPPMPATMDALAAVLPDVTRAIWPGQSHFASHTAPELFAATVRRFLAAQSGGLA